MTIQNIFFFNILKSNFQNLLNFFHAEKKLQYYLNYRNKI